MEPCVGTAAMTNAPTELATELPELPNMAAGRVLSAELPTTVRRRFLAHWLMLAVALLTLGGFIANILYEEKQKSESSARERLSLVAESAAMQIERRLISIDSALRDLRQNLPHLRTVTDAEAALAMYLGAFRNAVDGVDSASIADATGRITLSSRPTMIGEQFGRNQLFPKLDGMPDEHVLYVSEPFATRDGRYSLNLSHAVFDAHGEFSGSVIVTIAPGDFAAALASLRYTPDVSVGLIHGSGKVLLYLATPDIAPGTDVSGARSFFGRHRQSGKTHNVFAGPAPGGADEQLVISHTASPAAISMSTPLVILVGRDRASILNAWRQDVRSQAILYGLLAGVTILWLLLHQRRQHAITRLHLRHQAERQHDVDRLQLATEASGTGIWELDLASRQLHWDATMFRLYGLRREHFPDARAAWKASVMEEDFPEAEAAFRYATEQRTPFSSSFRVRRSDGEIRHIESRAWVYRDAAGNPVRMIGVNQDVTQRHQAERAIRESKDFIVGVLDSLMEHVAVLDTQGKVVMVNRAWSDFSAANGGPNDEEQLLGRNYFHVCAAAAAGGDCATAEAVAAGIRAVLEGRAASFDLEYDCHSPDEKRWFNMHATPLRGTQQGAVIAHENITQRRLAEEARLDALRVTQQFLDHLPGLAYVKDENLRVRMANRQFLPALGLAPETMLGKTNRELFPGEFGARLDADDARVLRSGLGETIQEEFGGRHFESSKFVIAGEGGTRLLGGITLDVTRKRKYLERQEALLRIGEIGGTLPEKEFLEHGLAMIERLTASRTGFIHFVGDDPESIELAAATPGLSMDHAAAGIWSSCSRTGEAAVFNDRPSGEAPWQRLIAVPIVEENRTRLILSVGDKVSDYDEQDCTTARMIGNDLWRVVRRVRAECALKQKIEELTELNARLDETNNKLLQSEKLASIGQLAAGVAHEINNPIGYVSSNLNSLSGYVKDLLAIDAAYDEVEQRLGNTLQEPFAHVRRLKSESDHDFIVTDIEHLLGESREGLERVRKIVQDLKDFSRVGGTGWQRVNIHEGLESTLNIVWNEIKYKAEVDREYGDLPDICCIPSQINQVFLNLLTNAAQSIEAHGHIVLRSGCGEDSVWVEIRDDGAGIAPENLERIFEPFFTTKPVGQGTGLGLSLSWGIVQRHHGRIEVTSTPGQGTCFRITLPIEQPPEAEISVESDS